MMPILRKSAIAMLICFVPVTAQLPPSEHRGDGYFRQAIILDPRSPVSEVREIVMRVRQSTLAKFPLLQLRFCTEADDCYPTIRYFLNSYSLRVQEHSHQLRRRSERQVPIQGEAIFVGENGVIRVRTSDGQVHREIVGNGDVLRIHVAGAELEVCWIAFWAAPPGARPDQSEEADVFGIMRGRFDAETAQKAFQALKARFGLKYFTLFLRTSPWFGPQSLFPAFYPYAIAFSPPTQERFLLEPSAECVYSKWEDKCRVWVKADK